MIVTVTPNPALDLTWRAAAVHLGQTHRVPAGSARAGGKGLNVSRVLHARGHATHAFTTCGGATGAEFRAELDASGVPSTLIPVAAATRRSVAIVDEAASEVSVFNEFGIAPDAAEAAALWDAVLAAPAAVLAVCGSLPPGMDVGVVTEAVRRAQAQGITTLVDTSGPAMLGLAEAGAAALKPNRDELRDATGEADVASGARALLHRGATLVVASLGEDGLVAFHRDGRALRGRFPQVVRGNATGAGDAVSAAMSVSLAADPTLAGRDALERLVRRCVAWGAAAVAMPLAGDVDPDLCAREADVIVDEDLKATS